MIIWKEERKLIRYEWCLSNCMGTPFSSSLSKCVFEIFLNIKFSSNLNAYGGVVTPIVVAYMCVCTHCLACPGLCVFFPVKVKWEQPSSGLRCIQFRHQGQWGRSDAQPATWFIAGWLFSFSNQIDGEPLFLNFFLTEKSIIFPDIKASETGYCRATSHCFSKNETLQGLVFPLRQTFQAQTVPEGGPH